MSNIKTYTASIIAALGIAGAALAGAGTATAAVTDQPAKPNITASPDFTPKHSTERAFVSGSTLIYPDRHNGGR